MVEYVFNHIKETFHIVSDSTRRAALNEFSLNVGTSVAMNRFGKFCFSILLPMENWKSFVDISLLVIVERKSTTQFDRVHRVLPGTQVFAPGIGGATNIFLVNSIFKLF